MYTNIKHDINVILMDSKFYFILLLDAKFNSYDTSSQRPPLAKRQLMRDEFCLLTYYHTIIKQAILFEPLFLYFSHDYVLWTLEIIMFDYEMFLLTSVHLIVWYQPTSQRKKTRITKLVLCSDVII